MNPGLNRSVNIAQHDPCNTDNQDHNPEILQDWYNSEACTTNGSGDEKQEHVTKLVRFVDHRCEQTTDEKTS